MIVKNNSKNVLEANGLRVSTRSNVSLVGLESGLEWPHIYDAIVGNKAISLQVINSLFMTGRNETNPRVIQIGGNKGVRRLSRDNRVKQCRAWLLIGCEVPSLKRFRWFLSPILAWAVEADKVLKVVYSKIYIFSNNHNRSRLPAVLVAFLIILRVACTINKHHYYSHERRGGGGVNLESALLIEHACKRPCNEHVNEAFFNLFPRTFRTCCPSDSYGPGVVGVTLSKVEESPKKKLAPCKKIHGYRQPGGCHPKKGDTRCGPPPPPPPLLRHCVRNIEIDDGANALRD
ncbi:hypothetical protein J6590_077705 [Homalodisca vitripennis]|nr:hypothetical protein J6590_077705 [Homalodisca vitripennis]